MSPTAQLWAAWGTCSQGKGLPGSGPQWVGKRHNPAGAGLDPMRTWIWELGKGALLSLMCQECWSTAYLGAGEGSSAVS